MAIKDEVIGLLGGGLKPNAGQDALAGTILGVAIGAQVDLGKTDDQILDLCSFLLEKIRVAIGSPDILKAADELQTELRK